MKKFKTKKNTLNFKIIILIIIIFILLSFLKINSNPKLVNLLLDNFHHEKLSNTVLINNLDYLINSYSFNKKINYISSNNIYLVNDIDDLLKNNLIKLGFNIINDENDILYKINLLKNNSSNKITINDKEYAKIKFIVNNNFNKEIINKLNTYMNERYSGISYGIYEENIENNQINIMVDDVNLDLINNSTEIIALSLYYINDEL